MVSTHTHSTELCDHQTWHQMLFHICKFQPTLQSHYVSQRSHSAAHSTDVRGQEAGAGVLPQPNMNVPGLFFFFFASHNIFQTLIKTTAIKCHTHNLPVVSAGAAVCQRQMWFREQVDIKKEARNAVLDFAESSSVNDLSGHRVG